MSGASNKDLVRAVFAPLETILENHDAMYGADWVGNFPGMPPLDAAGHKMYSEVMQRAFPDLERRIDDLLEDGDKVIARWSATGTHTGEFNGLPPTGVRATSTGITIFRIADGRIVEEWAQSDLLGLLQQLGAIPGAA